MVEADFRFKSFSGLNSIILSSLFNSFREIKINTINIELILAPCTKKPSTFYLLKITLYEVLE